MRSPSASAQRGTTATVQARSAPAADTSSSAYQLRPVTPVRVQALELPEVEETDFDISLPPAAAPAPPHAARPKPSEPSPLFQYYRWFFNLLVRTTTWISETSYAVSLVLLLLSVAGGMIGRHTLAALGVRAIVILNLVGIAGDIASLVNLSFRKDPLRGALFLLPPCTIYYLWTDWRRYRDTVGRMRIPAITLALVGVAYLFVPWLSGGKENEESVVASVEGMVGTLEEKLGGQRGDLAGRLKEARSWFREGPPPDQPSPPSGSVGTPPPPSGPAK